MSINVVLALGAYFLLPETKNMPLEQMDTLFGGVNHVDQGAKILDEPLGFVEGKKVSKRAQDGTSEAIELVTPSDESTVKKQETV